MEKEPKNDNVLRFQNNEQKQFVEVIKGVSIPFVPVGLMIEEDELEISSFHKRFLMELLEQLIWELEPGESFEPGNEHEFFDIQFQNKYEVEPGVKIFGLRIFLPLHDIAKLNIMK